MSASFFKFPYPLSRITGNIVHNSCPGERDRLNIDLVGYTGVQPVFIKAAVTGTKPDCTCTVDVWGWNVPLDELLLKGLTEPKHNAARPDPSSRRARLISASTATGTATPRDTTGAIMKTVTSSSFTTPR